MIRLGDFELIRPASIDEAAEALRARDDAVVIAGGTDLVPKMKRGQIEPGAVVSLDRLPGIGAVEATDAGLRIGALVTLQSLERDEHLGDYGAVRIAAGLVATPIIRARATVGGNLLQDTRCRYYDQSRFWRGAVDHCMKKDGDTCRVAPGASRCYATFCSDLAPALIVLDATVRVVGDTERTAPLEDIYRDDGIAYTETRRSVLLSVDVSRAGYASTYRKLRMRGSFDFPEVGVAVALRDDGDTLAVNAAVVGVGSRVVVKKARVQPAGMGAFVDGILKDVRPMDTMAFPPGYRKKMAKHLMNECFDELRAVR